MAANLLDVDVLPVVSAGVTNRVSLTDLRTKIGVAVPGNRSSTSQQYTDNNKNFNVLDYAVPGTVINTGVNDASPAILLADAAAAAAGGDVIFPPGTYKTTQNHTVARRWRGRGVVSIIKPSAAVTKCLILNSDGHISGLYLDGVNTTGATGISCAEAALQNIVSVRDVQIWRFAGVGGRGIKIGQLVTGFFENVYCCANYINCHTNGGNTPTDTVFSNCQFRQATTKGVWIETGLSLDFRKCLYESNGEEGFYIQNVGGNAIEIRVTGWMEGNWASLALGAPRHAKYELFVDGATGPAGTIRIQAANLFFNGSATTARAIRLTNAIGYLVDNVNCFNEAGNILVDGTSYGKFENWAEQNGAFRTTVVAPDFNSAAWNSRSHLEDNIEAAWTDWVPTYSGSGSMTYTGITTTKARYKVVGKTCKVQLNFYGTTGGVAGITLIASLPANIRSKDANNYVPALISQDTFATVALGAIRADGGNPTSNLNFFLASFGVWGLGAGRGVNVNFEFELF